MAAVRLELLGGMAASSAGRPIAFRTRKALALVAYLALEGRPVRRERLADLFWPEADAESARCSLRTAVHHAREALACHAGQVLMGTREQLGIGSRQLILLDTDELLAAQQAVRTSRLTDAVWREVERITRAYRGPFLAGVEIDSCPDFELWAQAQRERWAGVAKELLDALASHYAAANDTPAQLLALEHKVAVDPADEVAWLRLIEFHIRHRDIDGARRVWAACAKASSDFRTPLSEELQVVGRRLDAHHLALTPPASTIRRDEAPKVERWAEWSTLHSAFDLVIAGGPGVVIVTGPDGCGKTRLVKEFVASLEAAGVDAMTARAQRLATRIPYGSVIEALRKRIEAESAPHDLVSDFWLRHIARLLPELRDRYPGLGNPIGERCMQRMLLFESVVRLTDALAHRRSLVFWVDDAHRTGSQTRDLLTYALRRWAETRTPVLLILSGGSLAAGTFGRWVVTLEREAGCDRIELETLPGEGRAASASLQAAG